MHARAGGGRDRGDGDRPERRNREDFQPSRADETRDWGATRTFAPSNDGPRGGGRPGGVGGGDRDRERPPLGEADAVDDWGSTRKFEPSAERGGGFRDGPRRDGPPPRRDFEPSRADEGEQWGKAFVPSEPRPDRGGPRPGGSGFGFGDRPAAAADEADRWNRPRPAAVEPEPARDSAPSGERPRLKLAPRTKPVDAVAAPPQDAPEQQQPRKAASNNPFGAARPREEVLREKGVDPDAAAESSGKKVEPPPPEPVSR